MDLLHDYSYPEDELTLQDIVVDVEGIPQSEQINALHPDPGVYDHESDYISDDITGSVAGRDTGNITIDKAEQCRLIKERIQELFSLEAKKMQVEAIRQMIYERSDMILIAGTSFGKSLIFQAAPLIRQDTRKTIALVVMPLKAIEKEQCQKLSRIQSAKPIVLDGESNTPELRKKIADGKFTHVYVSPEIAISMEFTKELLRNTPFRRRLGFLAIDELHLVEQWSGFRDRYSQIYALRIRIGLDVPCIGLTATLSEAMLPSILKKGGFPANVRIVRLSIDRPNIFIEVEALEHPQNKMEDLYRIFPTEYTNPQSIPKTIIYFDTVAKLLYAMSCLVDRVMQLKYPKEAMDLIKPYFSYLNEYDKNQIATAFSHPDYECNSVRILCSTDAYGLGVDNPDVRWVIQWLIPPDPETILQRMGRAMRQHNLGIGRYLLLYPPWAKMTDSAALVASQDINSSDEPAAKKKAESENERKRLKQNPNVIAFINAAVSNCHRATILKCFDEARDPSTFGSCCGKCNPSAYPPPPKILRVQDKVKTEPLAMPWILKHLKEWRQSLNCPPVTPEEQRFDWNMAELLDDRVLLKIAEFGYHIRDKMTLDTVIKHPLIELYSDNVMEILDKARSHNIEDSDGPIFVEWENHTSRLKVNKKKHFARVKPISEGQQEAETVKRLRDVWLVETHPHTKRTCTVPKRPCKRTARVGQLKSLESCQSTSASQREPSSQESRILATISTNSRRGSRDKRTKAN